MGINPEEWFGKTPQDPARTRTMWVDVKDPSIRQALGVPEGGMPLSQFTGFSMPKPKEVAAPIEPGFMTSVKRGGLSTAEDFMNSGQMFSQLLEMPEAAEYFNRKSEEYKVAQEKYPRAVPGIEDIHNAGDFGTWAVETAGEQVATLASFLVPGGIVGKGLQIAGKAPAVVKAGGLTAGFLSDIGLMTGESAGIAKERGEEITDMRVIGSGIGKAMLDFIPFWTIAKQTGISGGIEKAILKHAVDAGYLKRVAGNAAVIMATEIPTETMQEWINVELDNYFTGYQGPMTEDQKSQLYNAAAGAALFGGLGVYAPKTPPPPGLTEADLPPPEGTEKPLGEPPPTGETSVELGAIPPGEYFDFRKMHDPKTGALTTTAEDYMRIVGEQMEAKYDPLTDTIQQPPSTASYTTVQPGWQEHEGKWILDAPNSDPEAARAHVVESVAAARDPGEIDAEIAAKEMEIKSLVPPPVPQGAMPTPVDPAQQMRLQEELMSLQEEKATGISVKPAFEGWDSYGNSLGTWGTLESALQGSMDAVNARGKTFVFDETGVRIEGEQDGHSQFTAGINKPQTPIEIAAVAIDQEKPTQKPSVLTNPSTEMEVSAISNDVAMMSLIDGRNEFLENKDNYRADGEMKKAAVKTLGVIDARIQRLAEVKGIRGVQRNEIADTTGTKIEETLGEIANEEAKAAEAPLYANLNKFEAAMYDKLNEREQYSGLSAKEWEEFERLKNKIQTGKDKYGEYRPATIEEMAELNADEQKMLVKVKRERKRYSKTTRAILQMRGVQSAKGNPLSPATESEVVTLLDPNTKSIPAEYGEGFRYVNTKQGFAIEEVEPGWFQVWKEKLSGEMHPIGAFNTFGEAYSVGFGASPQLTTDIRVALSAFWKSFNIRPKLIIGSIADAINGKMQMSKRDVDAFISSKGLFKEGEPGTVYINVDALSSKEESVQVLVHEMLVHFGLRALLPKAEWDAVLTAYAVRNREIIAKIEATGRSEASILAREMEMDKQADILSADEAIAYAAMDEYTGNPREPFDQKFLDKTIAQFRAWIRKAITTLLPKEWHANIFKLVPFNRKDVIFLLKDTSLALRDKNASYVNTTRSGRDLVLSSKGKMVLGNSIDSFTDVWMAKGQGMFLQAIQFAERYNLPGVADYMATVQKWAARKSSLQSMPVELLEKWQLYNKRSTGKLSEVLLEMTAASDKVGRALTEVETKEFMDKHKIDEQGRQIHKEIEASFQKTLDYLENGLIRQEIRRHSETTEKANALEKLWKNDKAAFLESIARDPKFKNLEIGGRLNQIQSEITVLRDRNYFPYMRFGRYAVIVRAKKEAVLDGKKYRGPREGARGQMIHFETHESYRGAKEAATAVEKEYGPNFSITTGYVSDEEHTMLGMPPVLYDTLREGLNLSAVQKELLKEIYFTKSPGQRFLKSMAHRKGIKGFSTDTIRVYATYMMNAANHIARIEHGQDLDSNIATINKYGQDSIVGGHVRDYWAKHYKYIMNPENDWAGLRAVGFMWYLGFNVKSAAVNMTQVPMVALPYLGARFGDTKAMSALTVAYKDAFKIIKGKGIPTGGMEKAIQQGIEEGFLDESLATILAGFSESSVMQRMLPESDAQRRLNQVAWAGSWMFRNVEKINRYVTFIAARKLALEQNGGNEEAAFAEAKEAVQSSMFEYAKWNRAPFMRGKKSVFFLFWSYMQGLAYLMAGGKGKKVAMRTWMMMLLAAGLQGIPFAENILDLIDWGSREVKEALGMDDPYTDSRKELRELASSITDNPDMLLHGWSRHFGLGPVHLLSLAGVPVPEVDTSGSISAGRWLPGTDKLASTEKDPDKKFGQTLVDMLGPVAGVGYGFMNAIMDNNPDTWKSWERAMPSALKAMSQGLRRGERGAEEFRGGGTIAPFDPTNPEDRTALAMNMLGFQPTKLGEAYEVIGVKETMRRYWTGRSAMVMENFAFAKRSGDPEVMADAAQAMRDFNEDVPDPMLRLNPEKIRRSMKARQKRIAQREAGLPNEKGYRRLYEEIDRIYGKQ